MNDKCAAGTGHFLELMSRTLEVDLSALGRLALGARHPVRMSSRCSIFVETEVIHFRQQGRSRADIAAGVADAMAERVAALARRISPEPAVTLTGGVAKNQAVRRELERRLGLSMRDLGFDPQLVGAYGAARLARQLGFTANGHPRPKEGDRDQRRL
jgi:predicted CoA-substrate-specific enzyme activase